MEKVPWWYRVLWVTGIVIFKLIFGLEMKGKENIPLKGGVVIVANHRSYLDPIVVALLTPRKMNFMAKEELFNNPLFGYFIKKLGAFPLKRDKVDRRAYQKALSVLKEGKVLTLFPEGRRSTSGKLGDLREGSVRIALHCKVPIVPVVIKGTGKALPPGAKMIKPGKIEVRVGHPIFALEQRKREKKTVDDVLQRIREEMIAMGVNK